MAAPVPVARQKPTKKRLKNGYRSIITFTSKPALDIFEQMVTGSGTDGGEPISTADMIRKQWATQTHRQLKKKQPVTIVAHVASIAQFQDLDALVNVDDTITETLPNGDTYCYFAFLQKWEPNARGEGTEPQVTLTIIPTMEDSSGVEQNPVYTPYVGTGNPYALLDA